jgi:hypothetical protein
MPNGIPENWDPRPRGALAFSHWRRMSPALPNPPSWVAAGASGSTLMAVEVEPGGCYLFGAAVSRGEARALSVSARVGALQSTDVSGEREGAMVAFCASHFRVAQLQVEAIGRNSGWMAALFKTGTLPVGQGDGP